MCIDCDGEALAPLFYYIVKSDGGGGRVTVVPMLAATVLYINKRDSRE
jgi:hypothetical protein